jgi:hypothetical protein
MAQIRFGILQLRIETGRFSSTPLEERTCEICNQNVVEDETHFLFNCEKYNHLRTPWLENISRRCPNFQNLEQNDQLKCIFNETPRLTAKFIKSCLVIRKTTLYK